MTETASASRPAPSRDANPFATCWTRPGALPYVAHASNSPAALFERLERGGWGGQIVGPHGAGKSAMLLALRAHVEVVGLGCEIVHADSVSQKPSGVAANDVRLVEGFERLAPAAQRAALDRWRSAGTRFVVTTHRVVRPLWRTLPVLARVQPRESTLDYLFDRLAAGRETPVSLADARNAFAARRGDLRAVWFDLYDLHERRTRSGRTAPVRVSYEGCVGAASRSGGS